MLHINPFHRFRSSSIAAIMGAIILIICAMVGILIWNSHYALMATRERVSDSYRSMVQYYVQDLNDKLYTIAEYMSGISSHDEDLRSLAYTSIDEMSGRYEFVKLNLHRTLKNSILFYAPLEYFVYYSIERQDVMLVNNDNTTSRQNMMLRNNLGKHFHTVAQSDVPYNRNWSIFFSDGKQYLLRFLKFDDVYIGACISTEGLLQPLTKYKMQDYRVEIIPTSESKPHTDASDDLMVDENAGFGDFTLRITIPQEHLEEALRPMRERNTLVAVLLILLVPVLFIVMYRALLTPIGQITSVMKRVQQGEMETRMSGFPKSREFQVISDAFNIMMDRIHNYKIEIYEKRIQQQLLMMQLHTLQINPHFFLNALNTIYVLGKNQEGKALQQVTLALIRYFREIFKSGNQEIVPLRDELKRVESYVEIQNMRYNKRISLTCAIEAAAYECQVPPMTVLTFVENSVKHAIDLLSPFSITISGHVAAIDGAVALRLQVQDSGCGFADEVLCKIDAGAPIEKEGRQHIGISNLLERIKLLYNGKARVILSNNVIGACVDITIPIVKEKQGDDTHDGALG